MRGKRVVRKFLREVVTRLAEKDTITMAAFLY